MRNLIAIRHSGDAQRLRHCQKQLEQSQVDFCVIEEKYHTPLADDIQEGRHLRLSSRFLECHGLRKLQSRTGWVCGDYIFYAAKAYFPGYDYYWVMDDDLLLNLDVDAFVAKANSHPADLMAPSFGRSSESWYWYARLKERFPQAVHAMFFGMVRLSNQAIGFLQKERAGFREVADAQYPNDESFTASFLANNGFECANLRNLFPEFHPYFSLNNPVLYEELGHSAFANKIIHPLCDTARARDKLRAKGFDPETRTNTLFRWYVQFGAWFVESHFQERVSELFRTASGSDFFAQIPQIQQTFAHAKLVRTWFYTPRLLVLEFASEGVRFAVDVHWDGRINFIARDEASNALLARQLGGKQRLLQGGDFEQRFAVFDKYFPAAQGAATTVHKISFIVDYLLSLHGEGR